MERKYFFIKTNNYLNNFISEIFSSKTGFNSEIISTDDFIKNFDIFTKDKNNIPIFYGILRNCYQLMEKLKEINHDFLYVDHGYFSKRENNISNYYRIVKNNRYFSGKIYPNLSERRYLQIHGYENEIHKFFLYSSFSDKKNIILIPPSFSICNYLSINYLQWIDEISEKIKENVKDKNIIVKLKNENDTPLEILLKDCYALIHHSSMASLEAIKRFIPVITTNDDFFLKKYLDIKIEDLGDSEILKEMIANKYFTIKDLLLNLSFRQFTIEEIKNDFAYKKVEYMYFIDK